VLKLYSKTPTMFYNHTNHTRKSWLIGVLFTAFYGNLVAQNGVLIDYVGTTRDASAVLDVRSTSQGFLAPRVALTATNAAGPISSPANGLMVYNTATAGSIPNNVTPGYYYWEGSWKRFTPTALPPSGAAGGDLSGTYPNPNVVDDSHNHTELESKTQYSWNASSAPNTFPDAVSASFVSATEGFPNYGSVLNLRTYPNDGGTMQLYAPYSPIYGGNALRYRLGLYNNAGWTGWRTIWDDNNDGAGSGMDADLLDGQQGSYYLSGSNVSGTAPYLAKFTSANAVGTAADGSLLGTSGTTSATRTLTILENGDAQINFGSYSGAWTSALQIQNNDNTDFVWLSPLENGNNARLRTGGSGLDIYVGGGNDAGTLSTVFDPSGNVGVGITPTQKLTVAGNINKSGSWIVGDAVWGANNFEVHNSSWNGVTNGNYGGIVGGHMYSYGGIDIGTGSGNEAGSGQVVAATDIKSPIYYDRDNTAYYANPASTSRFNRLDFVDGNTSLFKGAGNAVRVQTNSGYVDVGAQNTSWAHFQTDLSQFYFNKQVGIDGDLFPYTTNVRDLGTGANRWRYMNSQYVNTTDDAVSSGVTGIMVKQGNDYHRTSNAAGVLSFLGVTAPTGDNLGNHTAGQNIRLNGYWLSNDGGSEGIRVSNTGTVGIAEANPNAPLSIVAASTGDQALYQSWRYQPNSDVYTLKLKQTVTSGVVRYTFDMINNSTAYNNVLTFDRGNVGVGTATPATTLHVYSTSSAPVAIQSTTAESDIVYTNSTGASWEVGTNNNGNGTGGNQFYMYDNAYRMTVQAGTGNVGINTTAPTQKLDVDGQVRIRGGSPDVGKVLTATDVNGNANWGYPGNPWVYVGNDVREVCNTAYRDEFEWGVTYNNDAPILRVTCNRWNVGQRVCTYPPYPTGDAEPFVWGGACWIWNTSSTWDNTCSRYYHSYYIQDANGKFGMTGGNGCDANPSVYRRRL
jgi:hypothetical protein